jgi:ABC-type phosphate/phosphonate transport system substrate-binding protein
VAIHMRLFNSPSGTYQELESDETAFGRMGPASYVYLHDRSTAVRMLAMQDHKNPLTLALFTRRSSKVARLAESRPNVPLSELLAKRSLALTHSNSTTGNYLAKRFLAVNRIYATNLSRYAYQGSQRRVIDAVLSGEYDVGAGNIELLDEYPALKVIAKFPVPELGRCWVAGKGLDGAMEEHLRQCLLEVHDPIILGKLESKVSGFKTLDQPAFEELRRMMREAAAFDEGRNPGTQ